MSASEAFGPPATRTDIPLPPVHSASTVVVAGGPNASDALTATSPSASLNSASTIVVPGQVRSFDGYLDASGITAGTIQWQVINEQTGGVLAAASLSPGSPGQRVPSPSFTIPAGCSSIHVTASMNGATGTGKFAQPNCNNLNRVLPYAPNYATPTVYGLATSIVTTIDLDKYDTWQDCSFIAIEPDWNATVLESANAVLTALQTAATVPSIDSYTVSTEAQGFTTSGLTVTVPAFAAIFARGTAIVTVGGNSFTLIANAINRAWLNPNNTWTVVTDTSTVTGAIFFARFQTNATSVIGSQFVASVGVIKVGVGNVNVAANLPVPTFTTPTVVAGKSPNGTASDVDVTIPLTNVPPEAFALQFYHRISNPGAPRSWIPDDSVQLSGVPNPPVAQTVGFSFALMEHNGIYDFACGYESLGGYGPLTIIASAFAAPGVTIPTTYLSNNGSALALTTSGTSAVNAPSANGITAAVQLAVTVTNQPTDGSTSRYNLWRRPTSLANDATAGSRQPGNAACLFQPVGGGPAVGYGSIPGPTSGTYNDTDSNVTGGQTFDYGISLENTAGGESLIATIALNFATVVVLIPAGSIPPIASLPTANNVNVVPDSGFKFGYFRSGSNFSGGYWTRSGGPSFAWSSTIPLQDPAANNAFQIDAAHTGTSDFIYSKPLTLANGEPYTLSCQFFGDHASGTMPFMALAIGVSTTGVSSYVPGASIGALAGQNGRRSATFTAPGAIGSGTTVCNVVFAANGVTIASGFYFYVQTPMCEPGTVMGAYKQNELDAGTGYIDHLAHSPGVQSTVAVGGGIDFGYANHINKTQDNIQDGTIYQRNYAAQNLPNLVPNGNFQAPGDSAFSEVAGGWQDFGGNSQFSIGRETLAATPGGSDLLIRLLQNQSIPANTQVYRAVTTRKQILLSIGSQPYFLRAYIRSDYSVGLPAGVTATLTVAVRVTYTDGTTFDFGTPGVGQGVNGIVTKVFATDPTKIPSYAIVFCEAIVNNPTASAFATGSTIYLDARFNSITLTHAPTYSDGIDVNNLRPQEAGANVTENRTSNDVSVGNGRAVAQHGADVTGSNTALNTSAVGTTPAAALQAAVDASAIITGTGTSRFATGSTPNTGYTNNLVYVISIPLPSYGTWNLALNWFTTASPQLVNANLVIDASIAAVSGGQVNFFYAQISVNAPNGGVSYQNLSLGAECSAPGQGQTVSFNLLCSSAQGLIALRPGYWAITATRTS